jgi:hypothetical protein
MTSNYTRPRRYVTFLLRLFALLAGTALVAGTLPSCAGSQDVAALLSQPLDSTIRAQVARQAPTGKVKLKGHVTIQVGTGNVSAPKAQAPVAAGASQAQDYTRAGAHGGALATAPRASAVSTTHGGVPPWLLGAGTVLLVLALVIGLVYRVRARVFGH